jgi:hypothetical protein
MGPTLAEYVAGADGSIAREIKISPLCFQSLAGFVSQWEFFGETPLEGVQVGGAQPN